MLEIAGQTPVEVRQVYQQFVGLAAACASAAVSIGV